MAGGRRRARRAAPSALGSFLGGGRGAQAAEQGGEASSDGEGGGPESPVWPPSFGSALAQGPREYMEDALVVHPDARCGFLFAALFDGHEGAAASTWLRDNLYKYFSAGVDAAGCDISPPPAADSKGVAKPQSASPLLEQTMAEAFNEADKRLLKELAKRPPPDCFSGSCATAVLVRQDRILAAAVGDSRAVLARGGKAIDLTPEHRVYGPSQVARREVQRIKDAGGWVQQGRVCGILAVSRAFGDWEFKGGRQQLREELLEDYPQARKATMENELVIPTPDVSEVARDPRDEFVVVASDGLWDVCSSRNAAVLVAKELKAHGDAERAAEAMVAYATKKKTQDNVAVVVIDLRGSA